MFTALKFNATKGFQFFESGATSNSNNDLSQDTLINLNQVNIFVGQNNSGKSRFLRTLLEQKNISAQFGNYFSVKVLKNFKTSVENLLKQYESRNDDNIKAIVSLLQQTVNEENIFLLPDYNSSISQLRDLFVGLDGTIDSLAQRANNDLYRGLQQSYQEIRSQIPSNYFQTTIPTFDKRVYIPMLRGLKRPHKADDLPDLFLTRTINDYWVGASPDSLSFEIFTGLSLYKDIRSMLLGEHGERDTIRQYEKFLSEHFFANQSITLVPRENKDVLFIKIGDDKDRAIYDVGDGIQSIIIFTFLIFKYKNENVLFFFEEPEIGLHPGMQRILLKTITKPLDSAKGKHQFFLTTHSNHLLDNTLDEEVADKISIYKFQSSSDNSNIKTIENITQNKEILDLLGVRNSSVFLSNCIIWVEGISDRIYIRKWLELYLKEHPGLGFQEDKHYSILEYGGGNIEHFDFGNDSDAEKITVSGINKSNFLIADTDTIDWKDLSQEGAKAQRLRDLSDKLEKSFYAEYPEIENMITYEQYEQYFSRFEGRKWERKKSFGTKTQFEEKIQKNDIGEILKDIFIGEKPGCSEESKFFKKNDISIIGDKRKVAENMSKLFVNFHDLSHGSKELTQKMIEFIISNNS